MRTVGIIGSGISSLSAAYYLRKLGYDIDLYEAGDYFGGHTNTIDLNLEGKTIPVDTGFLVHNVNTYPLLIDLFEELDIPITKTNMSLSVQALQSGIEWGGDNLNTLFAQRSNLLSPKFWLMVKDILRFNKNASRYLLEGKNQPSMSLGTLLSKEKFSRPFIDWYLIPMGAAIWSTPASQMLDYPAYSFLQFCDNHGLLKVVDRPEWRTVTNGTRIYVQKILQTINHKYLNEPVLSVSRNDQGVKVTTHLREKQYDLVISGVHAPTNLKIFTDLNQHEVDFLKKFKYQENLAVVHSDIRFLPKNKNAWSAWNYAAVAHHAEQDATPVAVSYLINKLQPLATKTPIIVTLNPHIMVDESKVYRKIMYEHPIFDQHTYAAQQQMASIQGRGGVYFAGAWQSYGFHEDGIKSGVNVVKMITGGRYK